MAGTLASDNWSGAHPDVMEALLRANEGHAAAYGADPWTARTEDLFRRHFGDRARPFLVLNGTGANVAVLRALCRDGDAVICPQGAHIDVAERGAPERIAGVKLLTSPAGHGKLTPDLLASRIRDVEGKHSVKPRLVSISQATEVGTVYSPGEVGALSDLAHDRGLLLHVDGARLANAACALGLGLGELVTECGVDALSFGGTKNGLLLGDAVVFLDPELASGFEHLRGQSLQLVSKMRYLAAQFEALLAGDLWSRCAGHANAMARRLAERVEAAEGAELAHPVESNGVFAVLPSDAVERLRSSLPGDPPFHVWEPGEGTSVIRLVCSWDTSDEDVGRFASALEEALAGG